MDSCVKYECEPSDGVYSQVCCKGVPGDAAGPSNGITERCCAVQVEDPDRDVVEFNYDASMRKSGCGFTTDVTDPYCDVRESGHDLHILNSDATEQESGVADPDSAVIASKGYTAESCSEPGLDATRQEELTTSRQSVTAEEARRGLITVILYLQAHPLCEEIQIQTLLQILDFINKQANFTGIINIKNDSEIGIENLNISRNLKLSELSQDNMAMEVDQTPEMKLHCMTTKSAGTTTSSSTCSMSTITCRSKLKRKSLRRKVKTSGTHSVCQQAPLEGQGGTQIKDNKNDTAMIELRASDQHTESITRQRTQKNAMVKQYKDEKVTVTPHVCPLCHKGFNNPGTLKRHMRRHEGKLQVHQCALCDVKYDTAKGLRKHMESHKHYECKECGRGFTCNAHLLKHMKIHSRKNLNSCKFCRREFEQLEDLSDHIKIHTGVEPYLCTTCNITFRSSRCLTTHLMRHANDRPYKCKLCDKAYKQPNGLKIHILKHQGIREHMCSTCGKCFAEFSTLQKHLPIHTKEKNFVCKICGKTFTHYSGLHSHVKRHSDDKPYGCTVCVKKFGSLSVLTNHMRLHTGEKPYTCETCGKQFTQECHLSRHKVVHTGAKPYICAVCNQGFTQSTSCKLHMKNVHGQVDLKPSKVSQTIDGHRPIQECLSTGVYGPDVGGYGNVDSDQFDTNAGRYEPSAGVYDSTTIGHDLNPDIWR